MGALSSWIRVPLATGSIAYEPSSRRVICVTIDQAIVQPRFALKTEGPHGLPSGRQMEADPLYRGLIILAVYDSGHATHSRELSRARTQRPGLDEKPTLDRNRGRCHLQGLRNVRKPSAGGFD